MKTFVMAALLVVFAAVVLANEVEEEEIQFRGWNFKRCKSDSDCRRGCCRNRRCSMRCIKYCKSEDDCDDGQCCVRGFLNVNGKCRSYLKEGDKCYKSNFGLGIMKKSCGCGEGLECKVKKAFFFRHRSGKCVNAEGSGEM